MSLYGYKKKYRPALWTQSVWSRSSTEFAGEPKDGRRPPTERSRLAAAAKRKYADARALYLKDHPLCAACLLVYPGGPAAPSEQVHHKHGRGYRDSLLNYEPLWVPVCAGCHDWIHRNIAAARALGLYAPEGQWNRKP